MTFCVCRSFIISIYFYLFIRVTNDDSGYYNTTLERVIFHEKCNMVDIMYVRENVSMMRSDRKRTMTEISWTWQRKISRKICGDRASSHRKLNLQIILLKRWWEFVLEWLIRESFLKTSFSLSTIKKKKNVTQLRTIMQLILYFLTFVTEFVIIILYCEIC